MQYRIDLLLSNSQTYFQQILTKFNEDTYTFIVGTFTTKNFQERAGAFLSYLDANITLCFGLSSGYEVITNCKLACCNSGKVRV